MPQITPEAVLAALTEQAAPLDNPLIRFEGRKAPEGGGSRVARGVGCRDGRPRSKRAANLPPEPSAMPISAPPGTVAGDTVDPRLGIREVRFANGVRLNLKRTGSAQGPHQFRAQSSTAASCSTPAEPARDRAGRRAAARRARQALVPTSCNRSSRARASRFGPRQHARRPSAWKRSTTPRDLELQLQLLAAALTDPGYRPQGEERFRRSVVRFFRQRWMRRPARRWATRCPADHPRTTIRASRVQPQAGLPRARLRQAEERHRRPARARRDRAGAGGRFRRGGRDRAGRQDARRPAPREADFRPYTENRSAQLHHRPDAPHRASTTVRPTRRRSASLGPPATTATRWRASNSISSSAWSRSSSPICCAKSSARPIRPRSAPASRALMWVTAPSPLGAAVDTAGRQCDAGRRSSRRSQALRSAPVSDDTLLRAPPAARKLRQRAQDQRRLDGPGRPRPDRERPHRPLPRRQGATGDIHRGGPAQAMAERYLDPAQALEVVALPRKVAAP